MPLDDLITGWRFSASLMPWVRLSVLRHHGEFHAGARAVLPRITDNPEEGIWLAVTQTFRELGIDIDEPQSTMSSAAGYVPLDGGEVLPFLIEMRECVEIADQAVQRTCLAEVLIKPRWAELVDKLGGSSEIMRRFKL